MAAIESPGSPGLPRSRLRAWAALAAAALWMSGCAAQHTTGASLADATALAKIEHIVVIYAENRSFDHLYGLFPGANGIAQASEEQKIQRDHDGTVLPALSVFGPDGKPDPRFPALPNGPFRIDAPPVSMGPEQLAMSPIHAFWHNQEQIDGGRNDRFVAMSNVGAWVMGYYDTSRMKLWQWARQYTLADQFFMGAFGGSFLNHQYLICACAPRHPDAPAWMRVRLDDQGRLLKRPDSASAAVGAVRVYSDAGGQVTPDGRAVNTSQPPYQPSGVKPAAGGDPMRADPAGDARLGVPVPPQTARTIGDTLSAKDVSWAWYAGGWNAALADGTRPPDEPRRVIYTASPESPNFQAHHQPFNYYARFAPGTADRRIHLRDGEQLLADAQAGSLPQVSFYKPAGRYTQHPSYTDLVSGDAHIAGVLERLRASPLWPRMAIIVAYDENGGFWDHVAPPSGPGWSDRFGPGTRVPALVISPFARKGHVEHTTYDTTSIIKFITRRFDLEPLPGVRPKVGDLTEAFEF
jgi:acid phosphatase